MNEDKRIVSFRNLFKKKLEQNGLRYYDIDARVRHCIEIAYKEKLPKLRSVNQNAYLWGIVYKLISEHTGYTTDEVHYEMAMMFHFEFRKRFDGSKAKAPMSTTKMSTIEFNAYFQQIQIFAAQNWDLYIPDPNEELMLSAEKEQELKDAKQ